MQRLTTIASADCGIERVRLELYGAVQGVGFRPFLYRLAKAEKLIGFVRNTNGGLTVEVEGVAGAVARFVTRLDVEVPPHAAIYERRLSSIVPTGGEGFFVLPSSDQGAPSALIMPDLATCRECLDEIFDPKDRRFSYPFTTCVHCGPRYSIIQSLPYDRERTSMQCFPLCAACQAEYQDPLSRRFHAEPIACPECGPQLSLRDRAGQVLAISGMALCESANILRRGQILAVKGLGGYQLLVDASDEVAVKRLRARKHRPRKPFALMFPSLARAKDVAWISEREKNLLTSPQAPIVLLHAKHGSVLAPSVAPDNPYLGIMLPYTPLHHLLLREYAQPLIATSGNLSNEPIATDEEEALERLGDIADFFLVHDRPILRAVDDSVVRVMAGRQVVLRRARGYAPMPISFPAVQESILALGGQQKNAIATGFSGKIFLGPYIGDLSTALGRQACDHIAEEFTALHALNISRVACDAHPDYYTSGLADRFGRPVVRVPHHLAHVLAGMVDNELEGPVLGVAWDGTGYGGDATIWGGEFLRVDGQSYRRLAQLLPFRLPGGEVAAREPRRAAVGALYAMFGPRALEMTHLAPVAAFRTEERGVLAAMLRSGFNAPWSSSAGRLFDAAAALLDLCQVTSFEGEAAMAVEFAAERAGMFASLPVPKIGEDGNKFLVDWRPSLIALVETLASGTSVESLSAAFHDGLAKAIVMVAERSGVSRVLLTGGCFQNAQLMDCAVTRLRAAGFKPYWHGRIPPNDGGLAVGQLAFAAKPLIQETS